MGKVILKTDIPREDGFLYYCGTDKKTGNIVIGMAKMKRGGTKKKKTVKRKVAKRKPVKKVSKKKRR